MKLKEEHEEKIRRRVLRHHFSLDRLADDLIDHLYCYLHEHGKADRDFDKQLEEAIHLMAPQGMDSIEKETFYLLNFNRMILMKRFIFVLGLLSTMAFSSGVIFKIMHWPGANVLMGAGSLVALLIFLPLWAFDRLKYRMVQKPLDKWKLALGLSSGVLLGLGSTMEALHLMGAGVTLICGAFLFIIGFLPLFFLSSYQKSIEA